MKKDKIKISVVILTYNEAEMVENAIRTAYFADEILVIDSFSNDNTVEIVSKYTSNIFYKKFEDFSSQKNFALTKASHDWIYMLDADEVISEKLQAEVLQTIQNTPQNIVAYKVKYAQFFMNRFFKYGTSGNDKIVRLMNKNYVEHIGLAHEKLILKGECGELKNIVYHYTYREFSHFIKKIDKTAWLKAKELNKKGVKPNFFHFIFKPFYRFFYQYILRLGFLDGVPGLASAVINSYGVYTRYVKLRMIHRNQI